MFNLKIADHVFCINNKYDFIKKMCSNYITSESSNEIISVTDTEIKAENTENLNFKNDYLETLAVYRKICEKLVEDNIILFHCSAIMINNSAILFTAPSGTGKSTHTRMWQECFGERVTVINDDKPLIKINDIEAVIYGTPWCGKHGIETNTSAKIKAVVILEQSEVNSIKPISFFDAYPTILNQTYRPNDADKMRKVLSMINGFIKNVTIYKLGCNISHEAAETAYNAIFTAK